MRANYLDLPILKRKVPAPGFGMESLLLTAYLLSDRFARNTMTPRPSSAMLAGSGTELEGVLLRNCEGLSA